MGNREQRTEHESVHILMGLQRLSQGEKSRCIRSVDKGQGYELDILRAKLQTIGGYWRIHRTVNARDCQKAMKHLMCTLINHPEKASYIDSEWRTSLLQPHCVYGQKRFMLDIDTKKTHMIDLRLKDVYLGEIEKHETPKGWHYITLPFDTRTVCSLDDITLIRDGYYFIEEIGK